MSEVSQKSSKMDGESTPLPRNTHPHTCSFTLIHIRKRFNLGDIPKDIGGSVSPMSYQDNGISLLVPDGET